MRTIRMLALALAVLAAKADAGYFYDFVNVNDIGYIGGTNTVDVFLRWDTNNPPNELLTPGLSGAFTAIRISTGSIGTVVVANPTMGNDILAGDFPTNSPQGPLDFETEIGFDNLAGIIPTTGGTVSGASIKVGSFRLTGTAAGSVTIRAYLLNPSFGGNVATAAFADLDPFIAAASATFNVVPEPGTLALSGMGASLLAVIAYRRRKAERKETQPATV